ncbi:MAG: HlyD family efflux transporter periplasmic adaptor subunit [Burkholderiaceae bacterium]|jgi:HlyD family secretion protein|nr:HlyD family efflux transporter periplasmic adaptor subunit [Burkholderiaceae bacterium]
MRVLQQVSLYLLAAVWLTGCGDRAPRALGTLEFDRITVPAPVAEKIVAIDVKEGQQVRAGDVLLQLDRTYTQAQLAALQAQARQDQAHLEELRNGPRREEIDRNRANLAQAQAQAVNARADYERTQRLAPSHAVSTSDLEHARAAADSAAAQVRAAEQTLLESQRGTRVEQVEQGQAALAAASAQAAAQRVTLGKLTVTAPRDARVDSLPYKLGDQAPVGASLVVLLAAGAPYARVYVPEPLRAHVGVGDAAHVHIEGDTKTYAGTVRMIRSSPSFTPYYALTGQDAVRLSYLAEIQLGQDARDLPAGLPVTAEFGP